MERPDLSSGRLSPRLKKNSKPAIAVSITDEEIGLLQEVAGLVDYVELRVDLCKDLSVEHLKDSLSAISSAGRPIILTVRAPSERGFGGLSKEQRLNLYEALGSYAEIIDTEVREGLIGPIKDRFPEKTIMGSFHDFQKTPDQDTLEQVYSSALSQGADIVKIATRADSTEDLRRLARVCLSHPGQVVVVGMGQLATLSRVFLPFLGGLFTYAALGQPKAPGQIQVTELHRLIQEVMK